jgi:hypothetical protein
MNDIERLCDGCEDGGVQSAVAALQRPEEIEALANACMSRAKEARVQGDQAKAERLAQAAQYLNYLILPYD